MSLNPVVQQLIEASFHFGFKLANAVHERELVSGTDRAPGFLVEILQGTRSLQPNTTDSLLETEPIPANIGSIIGETRLIERFIAAVILSSDRRQEQAMDN